MADIFLSYAREDQALAERLAAALEDAGKSVWWDRNLEGGADFSDDIEREMRAAGAIVVAWSEAAAKSHWVRDEASYGRDAKKLVPITLDGSQPPIGFRQVQTIDFSGWSGGDDERVAKLASAIDRCCGEEATKLTPEPVAATKPASSRVAMLVALIGAAFLLVAGGWWLSRDHGAVAGEEIAQTGVAVLPFRSLSGDEDDRYFAEGLTEEILNRLGALPELRVTSRSASFQFAESELPLNEIADQLEVSHLVEGSVRRSGENWRVSAQLIRASDNSQLWSDSYDASGDDILRVQAEISERAAEALGVLLDEEALAYMERVGVNNPEAYAMFARTLDSFEFAHSQPDQYLALAETVVLADRTFELEPKLWQAQLVAIDRSSHFLTDVAIGFPPAEGMTVEAAVADARRRLDLARRFAPPSVYPVLDQQKLIYSSDWNGARDIIEAMLADRANCQVGLSYDDFLVNQLGLLDEYVEYQKHKVGCDPVQGLPALLDAGIFQGDKDLVREVIGKIDNERGFGPDLRAKVAGYLFLGDMQAAEETLSAINRDSYFYMQSATMIAGAKGDRAALRRLLEDARSFGPLPDAPKLQVAAMLGDREEANAVAARIDARPFGPSWLAYSSYWLCYCGNLFDLSATPNYAAQLKQAGATQLTKSPIDWPLKDW